MNKPGGHKPSGPGDSRVYEMLRSEIMRVVVNSELIRSLFFQTLITKWKMPEFFARDLAYEVEKIIKENEDD